MLHFAMKKLGDRNEVISNLTIKTFENKEPNTHKERTALFLCSHVLAFNDFIHSKNYWTDDNKCTDLFL